MPKSKKTRYKKPRSFVSAPALAAMFAANDGTGKYISVLQSLLHKNQLSPDFLTKVVERLDADLGPLFLQAAEMAATSHLGEGTLRDGTFVDIEAEVFCLPLLGDVREIDALFLQEGFVSELTGMFRSSGLFAQTSSTCVWGVPLPAQALATIDPQTLHGILSKSVKILTSSGAVSAPEQDATIQILRGIQEAFSTSDENSGVATLGVRFVLGVRLRADSWEHTDPVPDFLQLDVMEEGQESAMEGALDVFAALVEECLERLDRQSVAVFSPTRWTELGGVLGELVLEVALSSAAQTSGASDQSLSLVCSLGQDSLSCVVVDSQGGYQGSCDLPTQLWWREGTDFLAAIEDRFGASFVETPDMLPRPLHMS